MKTHLLSKINVSKNYIAVPKKEYEAFLAFKKNQEGFLTPRQKKALIRAEHNLKNGKTLTYE